MKLAKAVAPLVVAAMAGMLLQGCGSDSKGTNGTGSSGGKTVTLKVWGDLPNQAVLEAPFKKINEAFEKKNAGIKIQYDFAQNDQSLNVALQANELPDLFWVQGDKTPKMAEMVKNGFLLALDDYKIDTKRFSDSERAYSTVNGKLYASLPSFFDTNLVYYNKDLFEKNGQKVPNNWNEFVALLEAFKGKGITPISLPGKSEWDRAWPIFAFAPAFANDALKAVLDGKGDLTAPAIGQMLQVYRDFAEKGYFGKDFQAQDLAAAQFAFTNGKAAMIIDGTWNNPTYESSGMKLGRFSVPNKDGKRIVQSSYSNFMTYAVSAKTKYPKEAVEYVKFLNSLEAQQIIEDSSGLVPTIKDIKPKNDGVKELSQFDEAGLNIYSVLSALATTESNTPDVLMKDVIPKLMTSAITGEQAAQALHKAAKYKK